MRLKLRPIWVLVLVIVGTLIVVNLLSVQSFSSADSASIEDRKQIHARLDSLEYRIRGLEALEWR